MKTINSSKTTETVVEPIIPNQTIYSVLAYIGTDLAVTGICSLTLTPYLLSLGLSNFSIIMIITFASFAVFGIGYWVFKKLLLREYKQQLSPVFA